MKDENMLDEENPLDRDHPNMLNSEKNHLDWCQEVIQENPDKVESYRQGKGVLDFLVGQVMKKSLGGVNPQVVHQTLVNLLQDKEATTPVIYFYSQRAEHGYMSNFANYSVTVDGRKYKTSEHWYQSMKFAGTEWEDKVKEASTPMQAATLGRNHSLPLRQDWESVKDDIMRKVVEIKFRQHPDIAEKLLDTGDARLVEKTTSDLYWGCGTNGKGKNMLGVILMEVREKLRKEKNE